jgi:hypothetical protein
LEQGLLKKGYIQYTGEERLDTPTMNCGAGNAKDRQALTESKSLRAAIAERDRYVAENPHLAAYQAEIDQLLDKSGNHDGRVAVLGTLIQGKMLELQNELSKLLKVIGYQ